MSYEREKRLKNIVSLLNQKEEMTVRRIAGLLNVSAMTIRRDLKELEGLGKIARTHGGARIFDPSVMGHETYTVGEQTERNVREKSLIGRAAASLIRPGETVFLDSGTTTPFVAQHLDQDMPLTVLCYTFQNATQLIRRKNTNLILAGGYFHQDSNIFFSREGCELIRSVRGDKAIISAAGIEMELGLTTYFYFETDIKKALIESAKQIILVADSKKFGKISVSFFAGLDEVDTIITDDGLEEHFREAIRERGIELIIA